MIAEAARWKTASDKGDKYSGAGGGDGGPNTSVGKVTTGLRICTLFALRILGGSDK